MFQNNQRFQAIEFVDRPVPGKLYPYALIFPPCLSTRPDTLTQILIPKPWSMRISNVKHHRAENLQKQNYEVTQKKQAVCCKRSIMEAVSSESTTSGSEGPHHIVVAPRKSDYQDLLIPNNAGTRYFVFARV